MTDQETNLHPKNNPSINLKPNIVTGNIPDKAVTFKQLEENLQNKINSHSFQIAKNTADISSLRKDIDDEASTREDEDSRIREEVFEYADHIKSDLEEKISSNTADITKNTADITKNTADIDKNTEDIGKNTSAISSLETRTKNLEDSKVNVNTGTFDFTSDDPASQKSTMDAIIEADLNARFSRVSGKNLSGAFGNLSAYYSGKFHLLRGTAFPWGADFDFTLLFAYSKIEEIDNSPSLDMVFEKAGSINMSQCFLSSSVKIINATYSLKKVNNLYGAFNMNSIKTIKLRDYPVSFDISASTKFEESDLVEILNNLMDLTGKTSQTLTMGATNLAKLTDAEKAIATSKNWILA